MIWLADVSTPAIVVSLKSPSRTNSAAASTFKLPDPP